MLPKIQFILKRRNDFNPELHSPEGMSTGLYNSAKFMRDMLEDSKFETDLQVVVDNNAIDRVVTQFKPDYVIIEALWVVPTKFNILTTLHPNVTWIIRLHSELPFIAGEGMAFDWLAEYIKFPNVLIGVNSPRMLDEIKIYLATTSNFDSEKIDQSVIYLPNYYPKDYKKKIKKVNKFIEKKYWIDIACFGAVRPLKNHVTQAVAALKYCNQHGRQLRFHINSGRVEGKGEPVMNNLKNMFQQMNSYGHQLIIHEWCPREDFLEICAEMDLGLQCSFSETFNIVSADLVSQGIPIVCSNDVPWSSKYFNANPGDSDEIFHAISKAIEFNKFNVWLNQRSLNKYTKQTKKIWVRYFKGRHGT